MEIAVEAAKVLKKSIRRDVDPLSVFLAIGDTILLIPQFSSPDQWVSFSMSWNEALYNEMKADLRGAILDMKEETRKLEDERNPSIRSQIYDLDDEIRRLERKMKRKFPEAWESCEPD